MKALIRRLVLLLVIILLASCGSGPTPTHTRTLPGGPPLFPGPSVTPSPSPSPSPTPDLPDRVTRYYLVDRVNNNEDYAVLAAWGINVAVVQFDIHWPPETWRGILQAAREAGIRIVIWPADWTDKRRGCDAGFAYPNSSNGDISQVKPLLTEASAFPNFIGIVTAHEWMWKTCPMNFTEMAGLKTRLKDYLAGLGRTDVKVWNYTSSLASDYDNHVLPDNMITRIMDVAVIWKHCAGNAEGTCAVSLQTIQDSRSRLVTLGLEDQVDLVYLVQTFTTGGNYAKKFTLPQLERFGCQFLNTSALDGFGFYTWDAGWWNDLHGWSDLQPAVPYIHQNCTNPGEN